VVRVSTFDFHRCNVAEDLWPARVVGDELVDLGGRRIHDDSALGDVIGLFLKCDLGVGLQRYEESRDRAGGSKVESAARHAISTSKAYARPSGCVERRAP